MGTIRKLQILIAMKLWILENAKFYSSEINFESSKTQNFIAAKLNGFTVSLTRNTSSAKLKNQAVPNEALWLAEVGAACFPS